MSVLTITGLIITVIAIVTVSILTGRMKKSNKGAGSIVVSGIIMGTLVGGSSTIGTAQLAYEYGMSAWWFTLGGGIACLILALVFAKPFHKSGNKTVTAFLINEYGRKNGILASVLSSAGSFISIISQLIASTSIIAVVFPDMPMLLSVIFSSVIMILYVIFGGTKGNGVIGIAKMLLIYFAMIISGIMVLVLSDGINGFINLVNNINNVKNIEFFSLFARGVGKDLGACFSLILGVITTQSYAQAIFAADKTKDAVKGSLLGAVLVPPIGIGGILVGLYMRAVHPGILSKTALSLFITEYIPPLIGGVLLGTLFIAVIGTGAGLALGISTTLKRDIFNKYKFSAGVTEKVLLIIILIAACILSAGPIGDTILNFSFLSMAFRGAAIFVPLCFALFLPGVSDKKFAFLSIISGPLVIFLLNIFKLVSFDPLFPGLVLSFIVMALGCKRKSK